jgi:hypothetical protein
MQNMRKLLPLCTSQLEMIQSGQFSIICEVLQQMTISTTDQENNFFNIMQLT